MRLWLWPKLQLLQTDFCDSSATSFASAVVAAVPDLNVMASVHASTLFSGLWKLFCREAPLTTSGGIAEEMSIYLRYLNGPRPTVAWPNVQERLYFCGRNLKALWGHGAYVPAIIFVYVRLLFLYRLLTMFFFKGRINDGKKRRLADRIVAEERCCPG